MVRIRLKRGGKKFSAYYSVVVADARAPRDGKFIEEVGSYDPNKKIYKLEEERLLYWLGVGAKPSDTVLNLLKREGIWSRFKQGKPLK